MSNHRTGPSIIPNEGTPMYRSEEIDQIARLAQLMTPMHAAAKAEQYLKVLLFQHEALQLELLEVLKTNAEENLTGYTSVVLDARHIVLILQLLGNVDTAFDRASPSSAKAVLQQLKAESQNDKSKAIENLNRLFNNSPDGDHL